jgi:hypothetical protein
MGANQKSATCILRPGHAGVCINTSGKAIDHTAHDDFFRDHIKVVMVGFKK